MLDYKQVNAHVSNWDIQPTYSGVGIFEQCQRSYLFPVTAHLILHNLNQSPIQLNNEVESIVIGIN